MLDTSCGAYFSVIIRQVQKQKRPFCLFCAFYFDVALDLLMVGVSIRQGLSHEENGHEVEHAHVYASDTNEGASETRNSLIGTFITSEGEGLINQY